MARPATSAELATIESRALLTQPAPLPVDRRPAGVYLARLALGSCRVQAKALQTIAAMASDGQLGADDLPWHELRYQHTQAIRRMLAEDLAPATANRYLSALRGVLKEAWRLGLMSAEDYHRAADVANVQGATEPAGRDVQPGELAALATACKADPSPAGARDGAMLAVAFTAGLRRDELVALELADYNADTGELHVRRGKGRKGRRTYVANGGKLALDEWVSYRGATPGPLFCPVSQRGRITIRPMTSQAVYLRFKRRAEQADVARFSPHDGRRTWIGDLLEAGVDLAIVQRLAGHVSVVTTARYDRRPEHAKRAAVGRLHFPWR